MLQKEHAFYFSSTPTLSEKNDVYHNTDFLILFYARFEFVFVPYQTTTVDFEYILPLKQTPLKMAYHTPCHMEKMG
ncbi:hypothetical protein KKJ30_06940 [Xenorhabdus bovienii]|uniref:Uncharacterized protein n=1 Tax=Xenorhabdus bovienii str. Intermedium TaxID=1379677 RepID=A0A077QH58_XENBV|nr:hypothetical protein [Xenorhabdus bovienii]CDH32719.1 hypothetical protein XBI1_2060011 [Xenorhabdus bovienii str. Intermedium]